VFVNLLNIYSLTLADDRPSVSVLAWTVGLPQLAAPTSKVLATTSSKPLLLYYWCWRQLSSV